MLVVHFVDQEQPTGVALKPTNEGEWRLVISGIVRNSLVGGLAEN